MKRKPFVKFNCLLVLVFSLPLMSLGSNYLIAQEPIKQNQTTTSLHHKLPESNTLKRFADKYGLLAQLYDIDNINNLISSFEIYPPFELEFAKQLLKFDPNRKDMVIDDPCGCKAILDAAKAACKRKQVDDVNTCKRISIAALLACALTGPIVGPFCALGVAGVLALCITDAQLSYENCIANALDAYAICIRNCKDDNK